MPACAPNQSSGTLGKWRATDMRGGMLTGSPMRATGGSYDRLAGAMTLAEIAKVGELLFRELSTPDLPPLSTGANGAIVATATPADASAAASSVVPAGDGRSPLGDPSDCGLHGTTVPLNGAAIGTPRSHSDGVGIRPALPSCEGHLGGPTSSVALTDDGGLLGSPPAKNTCQGIVPADLFNADVHPSTTCDNRVTTIPIALHREPQLQQQIDLDVRRLREKLHSATMMKSKSNAAASVSTSIGGLLSSTEPIMETQNRVDKPPSIPSTGRGHPGVCADPLRPDDGGCVMSSDDVVQDREPWLPDPPCPSPLFEFGRELWRGRLVTIQDMAGLSAFSFNAVGQFAGTPGSPFWTPETRSKLARLFQDPIYGSRLLPSLPIEIRRIVPMSLTEPAPMHLCDYGRGSWFQYTCMSFLPSGPADAEAFCGLHVRLLHSHAYAIIAIQTSEGPHLFVLLSTFVHDQRYLMAMPLPDGLDDGDPCHCPGWRRFWHDKLQRPFWYHPAVGGTWRRPPRCRWIYEYSGVGCGISLQSDGWRGPYDFFLARAWYTWYCNAGVERLRRRSLCRSTFNLWASLWAYAEADECCARNLCQRTFRLWVSLWAPSAEADECFAHLDYGSDEPDD